MFYKIYTKLTWFISLRHWFFKRAALGPFNKAKYNANLLFYYMNFQLRHKYWSWIKQIYPTKPRYDPRLVTALIPFFDWMLEEGGGGNKVEEGKIVSVENAPSGSSTASGGEPVGVFKTSEMLLFCCCFNFAAAEIRPKIFPHFKKKMLSHHLQSRKNFSNDFFPANFFPLFFGSSSKKTTILVLGWVKPAAAGQFQVSFAHSEPLSRTILQIKYPKNSTIIKIRSSQSYSGLFRCDPDESSMLEHMITGIVREGANGGGFREDRCTKNILL